MAFPFATARVVRALQLDNMLLPTEETEAGRTIASNLLHPLNADSPIEATPSAMFTEVSSEQKRT